MAGPGGGVLRAAGAGGAALVLAPPDCVCEGVDHEPPPGRGPGAEVAPPLEWRGGAGGGAGAGGMETRWPAFWARVSWILYWVSRMSFADFTAANATSHWGKLHLSGCNARASFR